MELITSIVGTAIGWVVSLAAHVIARDAYASIPKYARQLIEWAVGKLPADQQERYLEEWLADLNDRPSVLSKFQHAVECCICVRKISAIYSESRKSLAEGLSSPNVWNIDLDEATGAFFFATVALVQQKGNVGQAEFETAYKAVESIIGPVNLKAARDVAGTMVDALDKSNLAGGEFNVKMTGDAKQIRKQIAEVFKTLGLNNDVDVCEFTKGPE
jgi:hypothetical protein